MRTALPCTARRWWSRSWGGRHPRGKARKEAAVDAGALGVIVNAMRFFAKEEGVQQWGARALSNITYGSNEWREKARQAGARSGQYSVTHVARFHAHPYQPSRKKPHASQCASKIHTIRIVIT